MKLQQDNLDGKAINEFSRENPQLNHPIAVRSFILQAAQQIDQKLTNGGYRLGVHDLHFLVEVKIIKHTENSEGVKA